MKENLDVFDFELLQLVPTNLKLSITNFQKGLA